MALVLHLGGVGKYVRQIWGLGWEIHSEFCRILRLFQYMTFISAKFWPKFDFSNRKTGSRQFRTEYFPTIDSSNFMHQKKGSCCFFILLAKIISTRFWSNKSRCCFGGKLYCDFFLTISSDLWKLAEILYLMQVCKPFHYTLVGCRTF